MLYNVRFKTLLIPVVEVLRSRGVRCRARVQDLDKVIPAFFERRTSYQYRNGCFHVHPDAIDKGLNDAPKVLSGPGAAVTLFSKIE
jgi:hypothetical protein